LYDAQLEVSPLIHRLLEAELLSDRKERRRERELELDLLLVRVAIVAAQLEPRLETPGRLGRRLRFLGNDGKRKEKDNSRGDASRHLSLSGESTRGIVAGPRAGERLVRCRERASGRGSPPLRSEGRFAREPTFCCPS